MPDPPDGAASTESSRALANLEVEIEPTADGFSVLPVAQQAGARTNLPARKKREKQVENGRIAILAGLDDV